VLKELQKLPRQQGTFLPVAFVRCQSHQILPVPGECPIIFLHGITSSGGGNCGEGTLILHQKLLQITHFARSACSGPGLPRSDDVIVVQKDADYEARNEPESSF
jgi:hypothetical protein